VAGLHPWLGGAAIVACATAAFVGGFLYWRGRGAGPITTHLLSLAQTLLVAQVGVGLLLLADDRRAPEQLHYLYGTLPLLVSFLAEGARVGAAEREVSGIEMEALSPEGQQAVALAIVRREMGIMAVSCGVILFLALRAAGTSSAF